MEASRRASLINEEAQQLRAIEFATGTSRSSIVQGERSTIDSGVVAEDNTDGV